MQHRIMWTISLLVHVISSFATRLEVPSRSRLAASPSGTVNSKRPREYRHVDSAWQVQCADLWRDAGKSEKEISRMLGALAVSLPVYSS